MSESTATPPPADVLVAAPKPPPPGPPVDTRPPPPPAQGWGPGARPRVGSTAVAVVALLLSGVLGVTTLVLRGDVDRLERTSDDVAALEDQVDEADATAAALRDRLEALEQQALESLDPAAVAAAVGPSVFTVLAPLGDGGASLGTGFVFGRAGSRSLLVTNFHVVEERWEAGARDVLVSKEQREYVGEIVRVRPSDDLALIEVIADLPQMAPADEPASVGDPVLVIGSSEGLEGTVTTGVVSAIDRVIDGEEWLQFSAQVNPGNSGGPVVDVEGKVLGVATFKAVGVDVEGLSFAIPVERVCDLLDLC